LFALLFPGIAALGAQPLDIGLESGIEKLLVDTEKAEIGYNLRDANTNTYMFGTISGGIGRSFIYAADVGFDVFWLGTAQMLAGFNYRLFNLGVGVLLGLPKGSLTNPDLYDIGFAADIKFESEGEWILGGSFVVNVSGDESVVGNIDRQKFEVYGGFWLPHILFNVEAYQKEIIYTKNDALMVKSGMTGIYGSMEIFSKSSPFRINVGAGWVKVSMDYKEPAGWLGENKAEYLVVGGKFTLILGMGLGVYTRAELPIYDFTEVADDKMNIIFGIEWRIRDHD
jgi:hypothetical protein